METKMKQDLAEQFARLSASWHDDGFSDGLRGVMTELHPDNPYLGIYKAGYEAGLRRKLLNDAAPELLAALKEIAESNTIYPPNYDTMTEAQKSEWVHYGKFAIIARSAIAKATGE